MKRGVDRGVTIFDMPHKCIKCGLPGLFSSKDMYVLTQLLGDEDFVSYIYYDYECSYCNHIEEVEVI